MKPILMTDTTDISIKSGFCLLGSGLICRMLRFLTITTRKPPRSMAPTKVELLSQRERSCNPIGGFAIAKRLGQTTWRVLYMADLDSVASNGLNASTAADCLSRLLDGPQMSDGRVHVVKVSYR